MRKPGQKPGFPVRCGREVCMSDYVFPDIGRWVSIFDRLMKMYYDRGLSEFEIGWGQQFYVEYLHRKPDDAAVDLGNQQCTAGKSGGCLR